MRKNCIFILSFVLIFTGCLPTPAEEVVIHKNEGTLEQQISATAAPAYEITIGARRGKRRRRPRRLSLGKPPPRRSKTPCGPPWGPRKRFRTASTARR